ncbi:MAG TPA: hypothetical protein VMV79_07820 [Alphaproteobacteria bacterium]|nr:hypothetical protein [Alphaproteobacteria bacterium]
MHSSPHATPQAFGRAANDRRPPPRAIPLMAWTSPRRRARLWPALGFAALCGVAMMAGAWWFARGVSLDYAMIAQWTPPPAQSIAADTYDGPIWPLPDDVVVPAPAVPSSIKAASLPANDDPGIAIPAWRLAPPPLPVDVATAMAGDPDVALVAKDLAGVPALRRRPVPHDAALAAVPDRGARITVENAGDAAAARLLEDARTLLQSGDNRAAVVLYDYVLAHDQTTRAALAGKAYALAGEGDDAAAAAADRRRLAMAPADQAARADLAVHLGAWGSSEAQRELTRMANAQPGFAPAEDALARLLTRKNDTNDALIYAQRAAADAPGDPVYRLDDAVLLDRLGRGGQAIAAYRQVLSAAAAYKDGAAGALPFSPVAIRQRLAYLDATAAAP